MLERMFLKVLEMSLSGSIVILLVLLVRLCLKRFPKSISYLLWSVVLFRLLCPMAPRLEVDFLPKLDRVMQEGQALEETLEDRDSANTSSVDTGLAGIGSVDTNLAEAGLTEEDLADKKLPEKDQTGKSWADRNFTEGAEESSQTYPNDKETVYEGAAFVHYASYVWAAGVGVMCLYAVVSVVKIRRKLRFSIPYERGRRRRIYLTEASLPPFVMGIVKPRIYLPEGLEEKEQEYIILHEAYHIRRRDYLIKIAAFAALSLHWFHPLVWLSFVCACKDMEMSCDEAVIRMMGEDIRADYASSLLAVSAKHSRLSLVPVDFGEGDTRERVKNLAQRKERKKRVLLAVTAGILLLILGLACVPVLSLSGKTAESLGKMEAAGEKAPDQEPTAQEPESLQVSLDISGQYVKQKGDPSNFYRIDEEQVLWGSGRNEFGQLGQGTQDEEFHEEEVKIAEDVIHVDFSQNGFAVFLTADRKLYGMGNAGTGALQQYEEFDELRYINGEQYVVTTPVLLMEDVAYACCGRNDIVCMKEDGSVYTWGTVYIAPFFSEVSFIPKPKEILKDAVLVTGGWFHHAALLSDGSVYTWGNNSAGNCGVSGTQAVYEPTKVAEGAVMVWTDLAIEGDPQPGQEEIRQGWLGEAAYRMDYERIEEFGEFYPYFLQNTVIKKADGTYWVCGEDVGTEERLVQGAEGNYLAVYSHEFELCKPEKTESTEHTGIEKILESAESRLREGYEEAVLTYIDNIETAWDQYEDNPWETEEKRDALAQAALKELYTLTGCNVKGCVYTTDGRSRFVFGKSKEHIEKSIAFYSRDFGRTLCGDEVPYMGYANARRFQYSDVQQLDSPYHKEELEGQGAIPVWFLEKSGVYGGERITGFEVFDLDDTIYTHVKVFFDGGYYVVVLDEEIESVSEIMGPYLKDEE